MLKPNRPTLKDTLEYIRSLGFTASYRSETRELTFTGRDGVTNLVDIGTFHAWYHYVDAMLTAQYLQAKGF